MAQTAVDRDGDAASRVRCVAGLAAGEAHQHEIGSGAMQIGCIRALNERTRTMAAAADDP